MVNGLLIFAKLSEIKVFEKPRRGCRLVTVGQRSATCGQMKHSYPLLPRRGCRNNEELSKMLNPRGITCL